MVDEGEISVCSDFGSSASELATCQRGVGIVGRHALDAFAISARTQARQARG
jgi:hypothetical protein